MKKWVRGRIIREIQIYWTIGCSPSYSDITISESVKSRSRGSDLGFGFITCSRKGNSMNQMNLSSKLSSKF